MNREREGGGRRKKGGLLWERGCFISFLFLFSFMVGWGGGRGCYLQFVIILYIVSYVVVVYDAMCTVCLKHSGRYCFLVRGFKSFFFFFSFFLRERARV